MEGVGRSPVYFVSLGCPKNLVDSQVMLGLLEKDRYSITREPAEAEVIIVNTCSFIQAAKEESIQTILEMAEYKESSRCRVLVVSGCLAQRYSDELRKEMPEVDLIIGTGQYHRITEALDLLDASLAPGGPIPERVYIDQPAFIHSEKDPRLHTGPRYTAYLKLSEGCNRRCTFCIIPKLRGDVRSRSIESLVEEARKLASDGVRELNLVAQDLTHYGIDTAYEQSLEKLLPELAKIDGIDWIRLHYVYPDNFSDELVEIVANEPKVVKYLDMPIQHTNDRMLKLMGRRLTKARLFELIGELRRRVPEIVFRTSIIVGFPGETEDAFDELCRDLRELDFDHVGVFSYSKEDGTAAERLPGHLHPAVRRRRRKALEALLQEQAFGRKKKLLGRRVPVLIEGLSSETDLLIQGRMATQAQEIDGHVLINDLGHFDGASPGQIVEVEITEALPHDFVGRVVAHVS